MRTYRDWMIAPDRIIKHRKTMSLLSGIALVLHYSQGTTDCLDKTYY